MFKTFADLNFVTHEMGWGTHAVMEFPNGYGVSVVAGSDYFFVDDEHPYELAVLKNGSLCYDTPITNDVLGHLDSEDVTDVMRQVQELVD
jgi:hypothetical protein